MLNASSDEVVAIKYQTSLPGNDPMNDANPTDVAGRVTFYGVSIIPNCRADGNKYGSGHPADMNQSIIDTRYAVPSPIMVSSHYKMIENQLPVNDSVVIYVKVKAVSPLTIDHFLQTVLIEREINFAAAPGSNGEKKFESVMKKMFAKKSSNNLLDTSKGYLGTPLQAMAAGDSIEFSFKWNVTKANGESIFYNPGQAALVAFVQNKTTKVVLQASYDAPRPWLALALGEGVKQTRLKKLDEVSFPIRAKSNSMADQSIFMKATATGPGIPASWHLKLVVDGVEHADTVSFQLASNQQKAVSVKLVGVNTGFENNKYVINLDANSKTINPTLKSSSKFTVVTPSNILLVDLAGGSGASRFTSAFAAQTPPQPYVALTADESSKLDADGIEFPAIKKIFYQTGDKSTRTIPPYNANMLTNYLSTGGYLFIIGQDIGFDLFGTGGNNTEGQNFFTQKLGTVYVDNGATGAVGLVPATGDPVFGSSFTGTFNLASSSPDQIALNEETPNADTVLIYNEINDNRLAAIRNNGDGNTWKCVYAAFSIETLNSATWRNALLGTSNSWFDGTLTATEFDQALKMIGNAYPNPASDQIMVPVNSQSGVVRIYDLSGKTVLTSSISDVNRNVARVNVASLKSGMYLLQVEQGSLKSDFQKIIITK